MKISKEVVHRIDPKLRMICNSDEEVNTRRAELSGMIQASPNLTEKYARVQPVEEELVAYEPETMARSIAAPEQQAEARKKKATKPKKMEKFSREITASVFVEIEGGQYPSTLPPPTARQGNLWTVELTQQELEKVPALPGISYVASGDALTPPRPEVHAKHVSDASNRVVTSKLAKGGGAGVLLGLIDVGGFDFAHPDFLDRQKNTRFVSIWDQGGHGTPPLGFSYGNELTAERMNAALDWGREHFIGPTDLVPQSVQVAGAHATHVASIAAGKSGVAPKVAIAGVLLALSPDDRDRRRSLFDSTRLVHAVDFLFQLGAQMGMPVVINISLGTNGHAHDGSSPVARWIDSALNVPGRCVCVAAGNAGQEAPLHANDIGFLAGRIHTSGRIAAKDLEADFEWQVVGNGIEDASENKMEIWYEPQDKFSVMVKSPSGEWFGPVGPGEFLENRRLKSETFLSIYSERFHTTNGANRISIFLSPRMKDPFVGVESGTWVVRLRGESIRDGTFHAWIERDDPMPLGRIGPRETWRFPSSFTRYSNVDSSSVSSLACGHRIVSVANYDEQAERINKTSSQGPTRDGRFKPEIAASGTNVVAARGFAPPTHPWISMTGTSMASPYVAGVAALMLAVEPRLTAVQIVGIMRRTAQPLPGADYQWRDDAGFGRIRPAACLEEAKQVFDRTEIKKEG